MGKIAVREHHITGETIFQKCVYCNGKGIIGHLTINVMAIIPPEFVDMVINPEVIVQDQIPNNVPGCPSHKFKREL